MCIGPCKTGVFGSIHEPKEVMQLFPLRSAASNQGGPISEKVDSAVACPGKGRGCLRSSSASQPLADSNSSSLI